MVKSRDELLRDGLSHIKKWCQLNSVDVPRVMIYETGEPEFEVCAYYRNDIIHIWPKYCAHIGRTGRAWSYPGYTVDRTPFGVIAHELGHHVDDAAGTRGGKLARKWRVETCEEQISGYADNTNEWFAEIFRVFVTNPDLLSKLRPRMFERLIEKWPTQAEIRSWESVLQDSERHIAAARNKIKKADRFKMIQPFLEL